MEEKDLRSCYIEAISKILYKSKHYLSESIIHMRNFNKSVESFSQFDPNLTLNRVLIIEFCFNPFATNIVKSIVQIN